MLVADKKLDEALEYYYVVLDQNIPSALKLMIKQNIEDIEQTIANTFRYSDTIVRLKESGEVSKLRVVDEIEYEDNKVRSKEIVFKEE
jgi:D-alanine-D-alanine ligase-like ATP-grasp enzyme